MDKKFRKELKPYGYMQLTKPLVKKLGLNNATFLCILIDAHDYWLQINRLRSNGSFYYTYDSIRKDWGMTQHAQKKAIDKLVDLDLIDHWKPEGTDKWHYKIHIENIKKLLDDGKAENAGPHESARSYGKDPIDSVGHDPMDSTGQTPSIHGVNKNIEQDFNEKEQIEKQELLQSEIESSSPDSLRSSEGESGSVTPSGSSHETSPDTHDDMVENIINTMIEGQDVNNASDFDNPVGNENDSADKPNARDGNNIIDMDLKKLAEGQEVKQCQDDDTSVLSSGDATFPSSSGGRLTGVAPVSIYSKECRGNFNPESDDCNNCDQHGHCRQIQRDRRKVECAEVKFDKWPESKTDEFDIEQVIADALSE